ncbi:MAG: sulfatase-like hydrolase/transferase [Armatimonadetes bacterium]|nr:sulfatase-like hydrolase/transferase [Armatimonadota bacterium]MDE2206162.1 sulfatase-like hydrolase/transferase [Armatimonadota bacterium]
MNVILVSMDTTRADRLGCYGYARATSPALDAVAGQGAVFQNFFSPFIPTFPGHTTMFTGKDIYAHGVTCQSIDHKPRPGVRTIAELLAERGYFTAGADNLGNWFQRGFRHYETYEWERAVSGGWRKAEAVEAAATRVAGRIAGQNQPFFFFIHYWDPHTPYLPPAPFDRCFYNGDEHDPANHSMDPVWQFETFKNYFAEWMPGVTDIEFPKAQYDAEIAYMDASLGRIIELCRTLGLLNDTLLAITADHGEELDEHSYWFDHHGLYDTNLRIPLVLSDSGARIPGGRRVAATSSMLDIAPTVLDYCGAGDLAAREGLPGRSLLPLCSGDVTADTAPFLHITENTWMKKRGLRTGPWKFIVPLEVPDMHGARDVELYDLNADPGERQNLAAQRPEMVARLSAQMQEHVAERLEATGLPDPLPRQPIPLRYIGSLATAVPHDEGLLRERASILDEKLPGGDFIGYERDDENKSNAGGTAE